MCYTQWPRDITRVLNTRQVTSHTLHH